MMNLKAAASRIRRAIKNKENIVLFSDADLDGVASLLILEEAVGSLGGKIKVAYFPNRETQGYGLSASALRDLKSLAPGLLILSDTGITNFKEIKQAKKMGFFVLIIDHHEIIKGLPEADLIINPKQEGDVYPFKFFSAAGLCFYLAKELLETKNSALLAELSVLAGLATIADMMVQEADNKKIIEDGLVMLDKSQRPGTLALKSFFLKEVQEPKKLSQKIISVLQLTDFVGNLTESYLFFKESDIKKAKLQAKALIEKSVNRKDLIKSITEEIIEAEQGNKENFVFYGNSSVPHLLTGNIASKVLQKTKKPTFIYGKNKDIARGSVRAPEKVNCVSALQACVDYLEMFGGHPPAAGFTVKNKNLESMRDCLKEYFK